jgi:hypothetical protein
MSSTETFMKALCSVMAVAIALGLALPSVAEAQSNQTTARKAATHKKVVKPRTKAVATPRTAAQKPCVRYTWFGCVGWDPDPNIRDMLAREVGDDDN